MPVRGYPRRAIATSDMKSATTRTTNNSTAYDYVGKKYHCNMTE